MKRVFDRYFSLRAQQDRTWDTYPIATIRQKTSADVLMVDVGGGRGHHLAAVTQKHPEFADARLVLQDLPSTLDQIGPGVLPENIEKQAYDFFAGPQPVKGR